jgi:hypothetical protein
MAADEFRSRGWPRLLARGKKKIKRLIGRK